MAGVCHRLRQSGVGFFSIDQQAGRFIQAGNSLHGGRVTDLLFCAAALARCLQGFVAARKRCTDHGRNVVAKGHFFALGVSAEDQLALLVDKPGQRERFILADQCTQFVRYFAITGVGGQVDIFVPVDINALFDVVIRLGDDQYLRRVVVIGQRLPCPLGATMRFNPLKPDIGDHLVHTTGSSVGAGDDTAFIR